MIGRAPTSTLERASGPPVQQGRRPLSLIDRLVRVPLGLLWLGLMAIVAVPVIIYMTLLYYCVQGTRRLMGGRARVKEGADPDLP